MLLEELRVHQIELEMQNEELRRAQADLEASRGRYFDLYDLAPVGYLTLDDQGLILEMNLRAASLFGGTRSALNRRHFSQSVLVEDRDTYFFNRKHALETGLPQVFELRMIRLNGLPFWAQLEMSPGQDGPLSICRIVIVDITERKMAEHRFDAFMEYSPAGASIVDQNGLYVYVNPVMQRHTGVNARDWIGKTFAQVWPRAIAQRMRDRHAVCLRSGSVSTETETLPTGEQERSYQVLWFPFTGINGTKLVGSVAVDITEREELEEALRQSNGRLVAEKKIAEDATKAKSQFLSAMTHEIRTPLNGAIGMADLLLHTELTAEQYNYARIIVDSSETLLGLVNNILDFSKIEAGKVELEEAPFDLERLIEDALELMSFKAREKSLEMATWYPTGAPRRFLGDAGRLRQILTNVISNAIKFTQHGHILVEVGAAPPVDGQCAVKISVHDSGIGIPEEHLARLFTQFGQGDASIARRFGGTGLGLSIVKQIVELMGGEVGINSMDGEGSTFFCKLRLKADMTPAAPSLEDGHLEGLRVLVSGSEPAVRFMVAEWCRNWEMNVQQCDLSRLPGWLTMDPESNSKFDAVIVDGGFRVLSGVTSEFRSHAHAAQGPKLLLLTSDPFEKTRQLVADAVLPTPLRPKTFREKLCEVLLGKTAPATGSLVPNERQPALERRAFKVLVVDDNLINQKLARVLLSKLGCEVDTADDGVDAVERVNQASYDLVFMDCVMPGMDGFAATIAIRKLGGLWATMPIVALTASATKEDQEHCFAVGMNDFLTKPIRSEQLAECLTRWVSQ